MNKPLNDGLLRLCKQDLRAMQLTHLTSGLDDGETDFCDEAKPQCGESTALSGYTEWVSANEPRLTLGWDWHLDNSSATPRVVRQGLPRTNVLVLENSDTPLPWNESLNVLATFIDTFDWNTPAFNAVCQRYA